MRLSLVSLVVLSYSATATQLCRELNGSENTSLSDVNSPEGLSCGSSQNSNVKIRSEESIAGNNVINKRSSVPGPDLEIAKDSVLGQSSEIAKESGDSNIINENSLNLKALDNRDLEQNIQGLETGCDDSMGGEMNKGQNKRDMNKSCSAMKSANIEKPVAECSGCGMKEDAMKQEMDKAKEDVMKEEKPMAECNGGCGMKEDQKMDSNMKDEKPMAQCNGGCGMKEDKKMNSTMKDEKPMSECNVGCGMKEDKKMDSTMKDEKPMSECNGGCGMKEDKKMDSTMKDEKPMSECNGGCGMKEDAMKASPPPDVVNPSAEEPMAECNGNDSCNKKDGASEPPVAKSPNQPLPTSGPMPTSMSQNSTVVVVVENHIAPCSVCQGKSQGENNPPNPGPVPTETPKVDAKQPSLSQPKSKPEPGEPGEPEEPEKPEEPEEPAPNPDTKSDSKSRIKQEANLPKAPFPSSAPVPSSVPKLGTDKSKLPIFTGDAMTASLRSTTLNIVFLLFFLTTFFNL